VFFDGDKLPLRQIELFHAVLDGTVKRTTAVTDAQGDVNIELSGAGQYLVNVVHLTEPTSNQPLLQRPSRLPYYWAGRL